MTTNIRVRPGDATPDMVQAAWIEVLAELAEPNSDARTSVESQHADPTALGDASLDVEEQAGDGGATILIMILAEVGAHVLIALWDDCVRPRIRRKFGVDAGESVG